MVNWVLSPSSINTYLQCPRKFYFQYFLKIPQPPSIHLVRGNAAHLALEDLYEVLPEVISENYAANLQVIITELLKKHWAASKKEFDELDMAPQQIESYFQETVAMLINYINQVCNKIDAHMREHNLSFPEAFRKLTPEREKKYRCEDHKVQGFIDVIENIDGKVRLMDYKTSKRAHITDAYKLQLAIYALLYEVKHGVKPDEVGIYFLKEGEHTLVADEELVKHAKFMVEQVHMSTDTDNIGDYPKKESPLCKWSTGQCPYYEYCFKGKEIPTEPMKRSFKSNKKG
jgi:CRISPR/Cas system-associated exonuclease Cas4 (RecB family)